MENVQSCQSERHELAPAIICERLPEFDRTQLDSVRGVFKHATPCVFRQAWLDEPAAGFSPARVRTGWCGNSLLVFAELTDVDIYNDATTLNQRAWELGDVFEMFLRPTGREDYVEFEVTPNNLRLQMRFTDGVSLEQVRKMKSLENVLMMGDAFYSMTWIDRQECRWYVYAEIAARSVCGSDEPIEGTDWRFSFARYDYTRGARDPVISSTSPHAEPDFHRQHEWGSMTFKGRL
jgi:hypothetical protein